MKKFLLDTSCFIDSKNQFYPFDFAPSFWKQLSQFIQDGSILIHEAVYAELVKGDDELKDWANKNISSYKIFRFGFKIHAGSSTGFRSRGRMWLL